MEDRLSTALQPQNTIHEALQVFLAQRSFGRPVSETEVKSNSYCSVCAVLSHLVNLLSESFPEETTEHILEGLQKKFFSTTLDSLAIEMTHSVNGQVLPLGGENDIDYSALPLPMQQKHIDSLVAENMKSLESSLLGTQLLEIPEIICDALWVTIEATALQAMIIMSRQRMESIVIVDDDYQPLSVLYASDITIFGSEGCGQLTVLLQPVLKYVDLVKHKSPVKRDISSCVCTLETTVREAIKLLSTSFVHYLIVVDEEDAVFGMLSPATLLKKLYGKETAEQNGETLALDEEEDVDTTTENANSHEKVEVVVADRKRKSAPDTHEPVGDPDAGDTAPKPPKRLAKRRTKQTNKQPGRKRKASELDGEDQPNEQTPPSLRNISGEQEEDDASSAPTRDGKQDKKDGITVKRLRGADS